MGGCRSRVPKLSVFEDSRIQMWFGFLLEVGGGETLSLLGCWHRLVLLWRIIFSWILTGHVDLCWGSKLESLREMVLFLANWIHPCKPNCISQYLLPESSHTATEPEWGTLGLPVQWTWGAPAMQSSLPGLGRLVRPQGWSCLECTYFLEQDFKKALENSERERIHRVSEQMFKLMASWLLN